MSETRGRERVLHAGLVASSAAVVLSEALGGDHVVADDVDRLAEEGLLPDVGQLRGQVLYEGSACREPGPQLVDRLRAVVAERMEWTAASVTVREAAVLCALRPSEFEAAALDAGLRPGRRGRWARSAVEAFAEQQAPQVRKARTLGPEQSARMLSIRRRELDYLVEAGLLVPAGRNAEGTVQFAVGALETVAALPLDWERAVAAAPRRPSPWAELAGPAPERSAMVTALVDRLRSAGVQAWARHSRVADRWTVDWAPLPSGGPDAGEVAALLPGRLARALQAHRLVLLGPVGQTMHWAHAMTRPGAAVVIDCESTGLQADARVVEVAAVDAHGGRLLFESLVHPGTRIPAKATTIHKITNEMVAHAPSWDRVVPQLAAAVGGPKVLLAYNASFDSGLIRSDSLRVGADAGRLASPAAWECLMKKRSIWRSTSSRLKLGGGHRARGDAEAAQRLLHDLTQPPPGALDSPPTRTATASPAARTIPYSRVEADGPVAS